jgi:hypothetical protein
MKTIKKLRKARKIRKKKGPTYHFKTPKKVFSSDCPDFIPF